jgi:SAM-dependent methyltransferase
VSGPAHWCNQLRLTARCYEPLWRRRSVALLTGGAFSTERELQAMEARLGLARGSDVIDLGCSAGLYARHLARAGLRVTAIDVSQAFLAEAGRLASREGVSIDLWRADVHALPFADASFDAAVCGGSLNEFALPQRALQETARVLRPGAPLWLMYTARSDGLAGRALQNLLRLGGLRFPARALVDAWAAAAGLVAERSERRGPLVFGCYRRGVGLPPLAASSPSPGWDRPALPPARRGGGSAPRPFQLAT